MADTFPLSQTKPGQTVRLATISDPMDALQIMRLGLSEGETLTVSSKLPGGPLVISRGNLEIALGRELCNRILCETLEVEPSLKRQGGSRA